MTSSVIIATNNRADVLKECLESLKTQKLQPDEIIIAHGGSDVATPQMLKQLTQNARFPMSLKYFDFGSLGAARQRNEGAKKAQGDIFVFLDDDVVCELDFLQEIVAVFNRDSAKVVGGVSGVIINQSYVPLSVINKFFFDRCVPKRERQESYAGKVVGPVVNFLPIGESSIEQHVDWLPSCCCAYRRDIFLSYLFNEHFSGYSFMEDVELSCRVVKKYKLINTTRARLFHKDLGGKTHKNWVGIGKMQVLNRWHVMSKILGNHSMIDFLRFFYYQLYCMVSESKTFLRWPGAKHTFLRWIGRWLGMGMLITRRVSRHKVEK